MIWCFHRNLMGLKTKFKIHLPCDMMFSRSLQVTSPIQLDLQISQNCQMLYQNGLQKDLLGFQILRHHCNLLGNFRHQCVHLLMKHFTGYIIIVAFDVKMS